MNRATDKSPIEHSNNTMLKTRTQWAPLTRAACIGRVAASGSFGAFWIYCESLTYQHDHNELMYALKLMPTLIWINAVFNSANKYRRITRGEIILEDQQAFRRTSLFILSIFSFCAASLTAGVAAEYSALSYSQHPWRLLRQVCFLAAQWAVLGVFWFRYAKMCTVRSQDAS